MVSKQKCRGVCIFDGDMGSGPNTPAVPEWFFWTGSSAAHIRKVPMPVLYRLHRAGRTSRPIVHRFEERTRKK